MRNAVTSVGSRSRPFSLDAQMDAVEVPHNRLAIIEDDREPRRRRQRTGDVFRLELQPRDVWVERLDQRIRDAVRMPRVHQHDAVSPMHGSGA